MATTNQHTATVVVKGETDGAVKGLKGVKDASTEAKKATEELDKAQGGLGQRLDGVEKRFKSLNDGLGKVTGLLGAGGLVAAAMGAAQALGEMADRAGQITAANAALKISIDAARASTVGLVSDFDLTLAANKAVQLGVVKTDEEFARLAAAAAKLGMSLGQDATKSVDDLTTALGRQSFEILDNLGIVLKVSEANEIWAQRLGKTADRLTDAEKKAGFIAIALERAEEAAAKSNVTLDTNAAILGRAAASWQNFKDQVALAVTDGLATAIDPAAKLNAEIEKLRITGEAFLENAHGLQDGLLALADRSNGAVGSLANLAAQLSLSTEELGRFQRAALEEQNLALAKERFLQIKAEEEERRKNVVLAQRQRDLAADELEISKAKEKTKKGPNLTATPFDRNAGAADFGAAMADQLSREKGQQEYNEAFAMEVELHEQKISALEEQLALQEEMANLGFEDADLVEELTARKYAAEEALLDLQMRAASTREQVFEVEIQKRRRAAQAQLQIQLQTQAQETKSLMARQAAYEKYGTAAVDVLGQVMVASIDAANGEEGAAAKALASIATGIRNQMILVALKEFALAAASAASFNPVGAAQHATAGGLATAAAAAAGMAGAVATAAIPAETSTMGVGGSSGGFGGGDVGGGRPGRGPEPRTDENDTPTSYYDSDLWQRRPDRQGRSGEGKGGQAVNITVNGSIIGGSKEELGTELRRLIQSSERAGRKVYS